MSRPNSNDGSGNSSNKWQYNRNYDKPITLNEDDEKSLDENHWESLLAPLLERDGVQCQAWRDEVTNLLLFSGLFATVMAAFIVVSYQRLQPDQNEMVIHLLEHIAVRLDNLVNATSAVPEPISIPSLPTPTTNSSTRINALWFTSLVVSLSTALVGILSLQWLTEHQRYPNSLTFKKKFELFHLRAESHKTSCIPQIHSALPLLLQVALILFFAGLIDFLWESSMKVAIPVIIVIGNSLLFLLLTTIAPTLHILAFCLPFRGRKRVLQQCAYKSPQAKAFQCWVMYAKPFIRCYMLLVYKLNYVIKRILSSKREADSMILDSEGLTYTLTTISEVQNSESWVSIDKTWLILRDLNSRCIFYELPYINKAHSGFIGQIDPLYDCAKGISKTMADTEYTNEKSLRAGYLCLQDLTSPILNIQPSSDALKNNQYLQNVLFSNGLKEKFQTFADHFEDTATEFLRDDNNFIFLARFDHPLTPHFIQHFTELHVRIMNYLYPEPTMLNPMKSSSSPVLPLARYLNLTSETDKEYNEYLDCHISSQLSLTVDNFFKTAGDNRIEDDKFMKSSYVREFDLMFERIFTLQSKADVIKTLETLTERIQLYVDGKNFSQRSDYYFYASCFYVRIKAPDFKVELKSEAENFRLARLALLKYSRDRNTDRDIAKRLGIPDVSDISWWKFLLDTRKSGNSTS